MNKIIFLFSFLFCINLFAQNSNWISLKQKDILSNNLSFLQSSLIEKEIPEDLRSTIPDGITNVKVSKIVFSFPMNDYNSYLNGKIDSITFFSYNYEKGMYADEDHKWVILGLRGIQNKKQILILDSNMNKNFSDDKICELPIPILMSGAPRITKMFYPSDTTFNYDIEYEFVRNKILNKRKAKIAVQVFSEYPTLNDSLKHDDKFRIAFRENLTCGYNFEDSLFTISIRDRLPWENKNVRISLLSPLGAKRDVSLKNKFQIKDNNVYYSFDSLDVLHKKILLTTHEKPDTFRLNIDLKDLIKEKKYRLVHYWGPWCVPCIKNMPKLKDLHQKYKSIEFIGVCADKDKNKCLKSIKKFGISWENVFNDLSYFEKIDEMNITAWPTYFILDLDSLIKLRTSDLSEVEKFINSNQ